jgi:hypothetical protein
VRVQPRRPRRVSALVQRDLPLELPHRAPAAEGEPLGLGLGRGHPRQLAHRAPALRTVAQRLGQRRQGLERARHAELLAQLARAQAEAPLHVLGQRGAAEAAVHGHGLGAQQPAGELHLVGAALGRQRAEGVVHHGGLVHLGLQLILIRQARVSHG